jgi:DNA-binding transcriptional LysR family regulator
MVRIAALSYLHAVDPPTFANTLHNAKMLLLGKGDNELLRALVALGLGLALAPARMSVPAGVVALPLLEPELGHSVTLGVVAGRPMNRAVSAFLKLVRACQWQNAEAVAA